MQRVAILGSGGAGKTTVALELGGRTGPPVVHLDPLYWAPGWVARPAEEFGAALEAAVAQERWILDGNVLRGDAADPRRARSRRACNSERLGTGSLYSAGVATAAIVTIGNELLSGDVANTNGSWLAGRLEGIGVSVRLLAVLPDETETVAAFLRLHGPEMDAVIVTGGLGGTPDDVTREALAATFGVPQVVFPELTEELRARFHRNPDYVTPWAMLPEGSRPLENPLGGAPGFAIRNVYVLPGLPEEMEAMYELIERELAGAAPIASWRRTYATTESRIVEVLRELERRHTAVRVGSYPSFAPEGSTVEVVLKSSDSAELAAAAAWAETALAAAVSRV